MTKSIEEQATEYTKKRKITNTEDGLERTLSERAYIDAAKSRDAQWLKVVNELKVALTKSKDTLQELNSDFGTFFYEDGSEETEQEVKDTYDHVDKTLIKAELMMKEMGISSRCPCAPKESYNKELLQLLKG